MKTNKWNKILLVTSLTSVFFAFTQCVEPEKPQEFQSNIGTSMPDDDVHNAINDGDEGSEGVVVGGGSISGEFKEAGATEVATALADVGIKDFEQIYRTMQVITGIDPQNHGSIRNTYADLSTQLPNENSVKQFNSSMQFAMFKLGSEFCDVMLNNANYYNAVFSTVNMGQSPNQTLSNVTQKQALIQDILNRFWGVNVQDADLVNETKTELVALIDSLLQGENLGSSATTRKVAKGVCASVIATPQVTML